MADDLNPGVAVDTGGDATQPPAAALTPNIPTGVPGDPSSVASGILQQPQLPPRPPGTSEIAQNPPDRKTFFRDMLGQFLYSAGSGLAASGHGPGANARGAGAAITALPQLHVQQQQLEAQRELAASEAAKNTATANLANANAGSVTVTLPNGQTVNMPAAAAKSIFGAQVTGASREAAADTRNQGNLAVQGLRNQASADKLPAAQKALNEAYTALQNGDEDTYKAKLKEAGDLSAAGSKPKSQSDNDLYAAANKGDKDAQAILKAKNADKLQVASLRNSSRAVEALTTDEDGNPVTRFMPASEAFKLGLSSASQGAKNLSKTAQINDIQVASNKLRDAVTNIDRPFNASQIAKLELALRSPDENMVHTQMNALANQELTPGQQDFVLWVNHLNERALSLRNIAGQGQGAQDTRDAIRALLPGAATADKGYMLKKLDAFDNQVNILKGGIPRAGGPKPKSTGGKGNYSPGNPFASK